MTNLQKIKEKWLTFYFGEGDAYKFSPKAEETADWWLGQIDQILREKREEVLKIARSHALTNLEDKVLQPEDKEPLQIIKKVLSLFTPPSEEEVK